MKNLRYRIHCELIKCGFHLALTVKVYLVVERGFAFTSQVRLPSFEAPLNLSDFEQTLAADCWEISLGVPNYEINIFTWEASDIMPSPGAFVLSGRVSHTPHLTNNHIERILAIGNSDFILDRGSSGTCYLSICYADRTPILIGSSATISTAESGQSHWDEKQANLHQDLFITGQCLNYCFKKQKGLILVFIFLLIEF